MRPSCDSVQEHLSAVHDGEEGLFADAAVPREHVAACTDCTRFLAGMVELEGRVAALVARPVPDGTAGVLAAAATGRAPARADLGGLRALLGLAALVQTALALLALTAVGGAVGHSARDLAVYELAAAAGLAAAALRPRLAQGLLPVVGLAAAAGLLLSVLAVLGGAPLAQEVSHVVLAVACWPLVVLARETAAPVVTVTA